MSDLRSRLQKLRPDPVALPAEPATPNVAERMARLRPRGEQRASKEERVIELAQSINGEIVAPGLIRVERRFPLSHAHGRFEMGLARQDNAVYFDTETTGLAGGTGTVAFVVGSARYRDDCFVATQWLLTELRGETPMLELFADQLDHDDRLVSFNGKTFDVPLLSTRFRLAGMSDPLQGRAHHDLIHPTRRAFKSQWFDCRLATVENQLLGVVREDDLPGAMAPFAFTQWLRFGDGGLLSQVLHHNLLDVMSLATLSHALDEVYRSPAKSGADVVALARHALANDDEVTAMACLLEAESGLSAQGRLELARLYKRRGQWDEAVALWEGLAAEGHAAAVEELAKYAEHRLRDFAVALRLTQRLVEQQPYAQEHHHRHARLLAKVGNQESR